MFNTKYARLLFGIIFLFSVFLFQGSQSEGCLKCENEPDGANNLSIVITNASGTGFTILICSDKFGKNTYLSDGQSWLVYVQSGMYYISAIKGNDTLFSTTRLVDNSEPDLAIIITEEMLDDY